jgi:hypothetical protein
VNPPARASTSAIRLALGSAAALVALTRPILPALPLSHLEQIGTYLQRNGPVVTAASGLRIVAICAAGYVLLIALLALLVAVGRPSPVLGRIVHAVTVPALRVALPGAMGLCLLAAPASARTAPPASHGGARARDRSAVLHETPTSRPASTGEASSDDLVLLDAPRGSAPQVGTPSSDDLVLLDAPRAAAPLAPAQRATTSSRPDTTIVGNGETATFRVDAPDTAVAFRSNVGPGTTDRGSTPRTGSTARSGTSSPTESPATSEPHPNRAPATTRRSARPTSRSRGADPGLRRHRAPKAATRTRRSGSAPARGATDAKAASARSSARSRTSSAAARSAAQPAVAVTPPPSTAYPHGDRTWTVRPGDHLWHIAHDTVATRLGHAPTDAAVAPYWEQLIEVNRARLVDPDNPDLIFPGQVFTLP